MTPSHHTAITILYRHFNVLDVISLRFHLPSGTTILDTNRRISSFTVRLISTDCQYFLRLCLSKFLFGKLELQNSMSFEQIRTSF